MYFLRDPQEVTVFLVREYMSTLSQKGHLQAKVAMVYSSWQWVVLLVITLEAAFCDTIGNTYVQQAGWAVLAEFICSLCFIGELTIRAAPPAGRCKGYGSLLRYATYTQ